MREGYFVAKYIYFLNSCFLRIKNSNSGQTLNTILHLTLQNGNKFQNMPALMESGLLEEYGPFPCSSVLAACCFQCSQSKLIIRPKKCERRQKLCLFFSPSRPSLSGYSSGRCKFFLDAIMQ